MDLRGELGPFPFGLIAATFFRAYNLPLGEIAGELLPLLSSYFEEIVGLRLWKPDGLAAVLRGDAL